MSPDFEKTTQAGAPDAPAQVDIPHHETAVEESGNVQPRWNESITSIAQVLSCFWSFIVMGANDAAYGALINYIGQYYELTYIVVSVIFLSPLAGYTAAALSNNKVHELWGQRGVAAITAGCHTVAYAIIAAHPPYPALVIAFMIAGLGNGIGDAGWNALFGNLANSNQLLGFLHGFYGVGAVISPLVATSMVAKAGLSWYTYYYIMVGLAGIEFITSVASFWNSDGAAYKAAVAKIHNESVGNNSNNGGADNSNNDDTDNDEANKSKATLRMALTTSPSARVTWICSVFLLGYVGVEVALGGWIVVFMLNVRQAEQFAAGMTATGFWLGITVGRFVLGFVTPRIGEKTSIVVYLVLVTALELIFWLVPNFIVSAVAVSLQGFFLGPLFPVAVVVMSRLLPRHLHVSAIGFAAAIGMSGAAILPFAVGAIAQVKGVQVLQPIILALLVAILILWCGLPRTGRAKAEK